MGNGDRETEAAAERIGEALASVLAEPPPSRRPGTCLTRPDEGPNGELDTQLCSAMLPGDMETRKRLGTSSIPRQGARPARTRRRAHSGVPSANPRSGLGESEGLPGTLRRPGSRRSAAKSRGPVAATQVRVAGRRNGAGCAERPAVVIVVDASVAIKWFVTEEPLVDEAAQVLDEIGRDLAPCSMACDTSAAQPRISSAASIAADPCGGATGCRSRAGRRSRRRRET